MPKENEFELELTPKEITLNCPNCMAEIKHQPKDFAIRISVDGLPADAFKHNVIKIVKESQKNKEI